MFLAVGLTFVAPAKRASASDEPHLVSSHTASCVVYPWPDPIYFTGCTSSQVTCIGMQQGLHPGSSSFALLRTCGAAAGNAPPSDPGSSAPPVPRSLKLDIRDAAVYARSALRRNFPGAFVSPSQRNASVARCKSVSASRALCSAGWKKGTYVYSGDVTIWMSRRPDGVWWNYSYTIHRLNMTCVANHPVAACTQVFHMS